jgi:hypothetical protein
LLRLPRRHQLLHVQLPKMLHGAGACQHAGGRAHAKAPGAASPPHWRPQQQAAGAHHRRGPCGSAGSGSAAAAPQPRQLPHRRAALLRCRKPLARRAPRRLLCLLLLDGRNLW